MHALRQRRFHAKHVATYTAACMYVIVMSTRGMPCKGMPEQLANCRYASRYAAALPAEEQVLETAVNEQLLDEDSFSQTPSKDLASAKSHTQVEKPHHTVLQLQHTTLAWPDPLAMMSRDLSNSCMVNAFLGS